MCLFGGLFLGLKIILILGKFGGYIALNSILQCVYVHINPSNLLNEQVFFFCFAVIHGISNSIDN